MKDFAKYLLTLLLLSIVCVVNASMYVVQRENTSRVRNLPVLLNEVKHSAEVEIMHNRAEFNKFWNRNMERVQKSNSAFLSESILTKTSQFLSARPSVKTMLNSHRSGIRKKEKVDDNSIIVEPDDGESKMYIRTGNAYFWKDNQFQSGEQSGMTEIVVTADNDVYIKDFVSHTSFGTWIRGRKNGNIITIPSGQVINYWSDYNYGMYVSMASYNEDGSITEDDGDITLTIDNDVISLDGTNDRHFVACFWTDNLVFSGYGDYNTVFTYDENYIVPKLVELPEGANVETWYGNYSMVSGNGDSEYQATVKVAFVDNDIYLGGVFQNFPNSWIKGAIENNRVSFSGFQYVGDYSAAYNIYAIGLDNSGLNDFLMIYDAEKQTLTSVNSLLANAAFDRVDYLEYYEKIVLSKDEPIVKMDTISIYVDSENSPYLYTWGKKTIADWPGVKMTEQTEVGGMKFWKMDVTVINSISAVSLVANGDFEGDNVDNFISKEYPSSEMNGASIVEGAGKDNSRCVVVKSADETEIETANIWDSQFWIYFNSPINSGTKLHIEFDYKANKETWASTQSHAEPGSYIYGDCIGVVNFTTEWQHFETEIEVSSDMAGEYGMQSIAFNLAEDKTATDYYFDNFNVQVISDFYEPLNIILNNGGSYQTADINNVEGKRYYWYGGKTTYKDVTEEVEKGTYKTPMIEEIYFANDYNFYYYEGDTLYYDNVKMTFHNNSGNQPYNYYGTIRFYKGNSMTFVSEIPMVDIQFYTDYDESYYVRGQASVGVLEDNHWIGDTSELTITNNTGNQQRFNKVVITYDNPTDSEIFERLQKQLDESESALANLAYTNVPGHDYVSQLVSLGRDIELNEGFDGTYVKRLIQELKQQTEWMTMLDGYYQLIANRIAALPIMAANNKYVDPQILAEAVAYGEELTAGLAEGKYSWDALPEIYNRLNEYANIFHENYLVFHIEEPGSLGDSILACVENFSDVIGLRVSGNLNTSDMDNLKSRLTNVKYLNLGETNLYYIASEQFRNHTNLQKIVLPKGLNRIDSYAFYGCTNLLDTEFPASLRTIDSYAFYNCAFENVVVPEGVTTINQYAFACSDNYTSYYDENGNYISNYYYAKLLKVNLPSTLRTLGNDAFAYQRNLSSVYISDGLSAIPSYAFFYCSGLTNLRLPATLNTIDYEAFYSCSSLKRVILPEGITTVGNYAFSYCSNLEEVILPTTLTSLNYSFSNCNKLTRMTCKAIVPPSANNRSILGGQEYMCMLTVPNLSINVYKQTSYWDQFNIVGTDILPQNITIAQDYRLSWNNNSLMDGSELVSNGNLEGSDYSNFVTQKLDENGSRYKETSSVVEGDGVDGSYGIMIEADPITESSYEWDTQFFVQLNRSLPAGTRYHVEFDYKATNECDVPTQTHASPGDYIHWQMFPVLHFTSEWQHYDALGEITSEQSLEGKQMQTIAFNLAVNEEATQFFFDNVKFTIIYKPNVRIENTGRLEVTGNSTLSASSFTMVYDENLDYQYNYGDRSSSASAISASLINKANVRADNVTIDLWTRANKWTFFSMPFDVKVSNIGEQNPGTPFVIRKYDGQKRANSEMYNTWVDMTSDSILHAGEGYIIQSPNRDNNYYNGFWFTAEQNINKNRIFANEDVEVQLAEYQSEFPQNRSWNLIGNPYPCYYDTRAIDVTTPITVWNVYNSNYQAYSPVDDNLILRPGEAFFIQRPVDQTSITFLKEGRQTNYNVRNVNYFAGARQSDMTAQRSVFNLVLGNGELSDRTRFVINSEAQMGYEIHCDASKFMSDDAIMQLYTIEQGVRLSINERPMAKGELTLGVMFSKKGTYTISLDTQVNNEVWLVDRLSGTEILLDEVGYSFEAEAGTFDDRFVVRLGNGDVTGINTIGISEGTSKIYNLNGIRVEQPTKGLYINNGKKVVVK